MKVLKANQRVPNPPVPVIEYPVNDLMLTAPIKWNMKKMPQFKESVEAVGMIWPIIIVDLENYWQPMKDDRWPRNESTGEFIPGVAVHTGNKRVMWARENGYDLIESYLVTDRNHKDEIVRQTFIARGLWPTKNQ